MQLPKKPPCVKARQRVGERPVQWVEVFPGRVPGYYMKRSVLAVVRTCMKGAQVQVGGHQERTYLVVQHDKYAYQFCLYRLKDLEGAHSVVTQRIEDALKKKAA